MSREGRHRPSIDSEYQGMLRKNIDYFTLSKNLGLLYSLSHSGNTYLLAITFIFYLILFLVRNLTKNSFYYCCLGVHLLL